MATVAISVSRSPYHVTLCGRISLQPLPADVVVPIGFDAPDQICPLSRFVPNLVAWAQVDDALDWLDRLAEL